MSLQEFIDNFAIFVNARNGVSKLRELILQLAVEGRLVPQNPNDAPASTLLAEIAAERNRKAQRNGDRNVPELPSISLDATPFGLPAGWTWERLGNIGETNIGLTYSPKDIASTGIPVLRSNNIQNGKLNLSDLVRVDLKPKPSVMVDAGDLLICARNGSRALVGKSALIDNLSERTAFGAFMAIFRSSLNEYLYWFIMSPLFRRMIDDVNTTTINQITQTNLRSTIAPIPPLAEQKRIVAKVGELMRLCDELEERQQAKRESRLRLNNAVLAPLNKAASLTPEEFRQATIRLADNFDQLYDSIDTVAKLRSTILQLAIQGKLVPQDPGDERVEGLLQTLAEHRRNKIEGNRSNMPKPSEPIEDEEKPFRLPSSWVWARLGDIVSIKHGFAFSSEWFTGEATPFVLTTPGNFHEKGGFRDRGLKTKYYKGPVYPEFIFNAGDLIIPMTEQAPGLLGSPAFIPDDGLAYVHNQRLGKLLFDCDAIAPEFVFWFFNSVYFRSELAKTCTGMKVRHTSPKKILRVLFPVCSLAEQRRIVAKVDQLMALCNELDAKLRQAEAEGKKLMNAAVKHVLTTISQRSAIKSNLEQPASPSEEPAFLLRTTS